ncbi:MAG TPA: ACT domain-containing protein [Fibrobacteraceae bacterium]|nr:ACT domain-containing protein [Fibrobacteraceae bacterium]
MKIQQISVFLENRPGRLGALCSILAEAGVNLSTLSLADTGEFGLLRLITSDPDKTLRTLTAAGYAVAQSEVIALQVPDRPGGLAGVLEIIEKEGVSVEYMYAFALRSGQDAVMVFRFSDMDKAIDALHSAGINALHVVDQLGR